MNFNIQMGIPEMQNLWLDLQEKYRSGTIKKKEEQLYKKWGKALKLLSIDPGYPSLQTHEIEPLSKRYGMKVWQSYLENKNQSNPIVVQWREDSKIVEAFADTIFALRGFSECPAQRI